MGTSSDKRIKEMITKNISDIFNHCAEVKKSINDNLENTLDYFNALLAQIPESTSGPLIAHTPKIAKKRGRKNIQTIPENDVIITDNKSSIKAEAKHRTSEILEETISGRSRRQASKKAADSIREQQSLTLTTKLRRPDTEENTKKKRTSQLKRKKATKSGSEDEQTGGPTKHSKMEESVVSKASTISQIHISVTEVPTQETKIKPSKTPVTRSSSRKRSRSQSENVKNCDMDDTVIAPQGNEIQEQSVYEDAIGKPALNSTMNFNSTYNLQNMVNATVILERVSAVKLNETVTLNKNLVAKNKEKESVDHHKIKGDKQPVKRSLLHSSINKPDKQQQQKQLIANEELDELLTEDESSPEVKKRKASLRKRPKRVPDSMSSSEEEVLSTPMKPTLKEKNTVTGFQSVKTKSNTLFSPYAKESVKKRIEAFEQVGMSPKAVNIEEPVRLTRTKTRARAAAQAEAMENANSVDKTVVQKLARKSLAKAKKISLAIQNKNNDEQKENNLLLSSQKGNKLITAEKLNAMKQLKATPLYKGKTQLPMSVTRIPHTPVNQVNSNYKALSATRTNIITSVDSFIQQPKSVSKRNSLEKQEEKKRKLNDEDAKKKREEALRLLTEEKRRKRQEKELKNKLAREAKERQDMEKRQKAEREREEKARLAQQLQEKQHQEMEKKRLAQLQRAQEKEERRRQEEQQRLQRLQEQEEAERVLAEQRRREQEAEKRKEAEARAQQQAAIEAIKAKNQLQQAKYGNKNNGPTTYILDSEPDEDDSDDETKPKHAIPHWALPHVRKTQLAMQRYIPPKAINLFFDTKKCTPDLTQLFQGIDRNRLKRTSSAIWKTPPRYSMMVSEYEGSVRF